MVFNGRFCQVVLLQKQPPEVFCIKGVLKNFANFASRQENPVRVLKVKFNPFLAYVIFSSSSVVFRECKKGRLT